MRSGIFVSTSIISRPQVDAVSTVVGCMPQRLVTFRLGMQALQPRIILWRFVQNDHANLPPAQILPPHQIIPIALNHSIRPTMPLCCRSFHQASYRMRVGCAASTPTTVELAPLIFRISGFGFRICELHSLLQHLLHQIRICIFLGHFIDDCLPLLFHALSGTEAFLLFVPGTDESHPSIDQGPHALVGHRP